MQRPPPRSTPPDTLFPATTLFRSGLKLHYMPVGAPGWGSAADTLELAAADFGLAELARAAGDTAGARQFRERSGWWRNLYNPKATPEGGYIQPRNADGSWPAFDPSRSEEHTSELQSLMRIAYAV